MYKSIRVAPTSCSRKLQIAGRACGGSKLGISRTAHSSSSLAARRHYSTPSRFAAIPLPACEFLEMCVYLSRSGGRLRNCLGTAAQESLPFGAVTSPGDTLTESSGLA